MFRFHTATRENAYNNVAAVWLCKLCGCLAHLGGIAQICHALLFPVIKFTGIRDRRSNNLSLLPIRGSRKIHLPCFSSYCQ